MRENKPATTRMPTVDALKGVAIVLVVLGHAIQQWMPAYSSTLTFRLIYSFHMPLFMLLSGFVVGIRRDGYGPRWLGGRAASLLAPAIAWIPLYWVLARSRAANLSTFMDPALGLGESLRAYALDMPLLWYLPVLFICCVVFATVISVPRVPTAAALLAGLLLIRLLTVLTGWSMFGFAQWYFIFFALGVLLRRARFDRVPAVSRAVALLAFPIASGVALAFLPAEAVGDASAAATLLDLAARFVWALTGIAFVWALVDLGARATDLKPLRMLGLVTIEVYTAHFLFLGMSAGSGPARVLTAWVAATTLALACSFVLDRVPIARAILFGRWFSADPYSAWYRPVTERSG